MELAKTSVKLDAVLEGNKEMKAAQDKQREELGALKVKVYSMAAVLSIVSSLATSWVKGEFGVS